MTNSATDNNVLTNFQPMPKRFMVWDTLHKDWREWKTAGDEKWNNIFELHQLSVFLVNASNNGLPHTRFKICQSTNLFDKDGKEIFEGSIVKSDEGAIFMVRQDRYRGTWLLKNIRTGDCGNSIDGWDDGRDDGLILIGHILSNPELVEEKK